MTSAATAWTWWGQICEVYEVQGFQTQVLAASLRSPLHVVQAAECGAHVGTMPFKVMDMCFNHPLTDRGIEQFMKDYNKAFEPAGARS